jgi:hypothetical protein
MVSPKKNLPMELHSTNTKKLLENVRPKFHFEVFLGIFDKFDEDSIVVLFTNIFKLYTHQY